MKRLRALFVFAIIRLGGSADWAQDVTAHFVEPHTREHVQAVATGNGKPIMVVAMTTWCAACSALRASVNGGKRVKPLLDKFTVAYATEEGAANVWTEKGQDYVPQVYFFNAAGAQLPVYNPDMKFKYYFGNEDLLEAGMTKALELASGEQQTTTASGEQAAVFDPTHAFDASVAALFSDNLTPEIMRQKAIAENRPFMVLLTQSWCQACVDLIRAINGGNHTKDLLSSFVAMHAYGADGLKNWQPQGESYVPQALFFDIDGSLLDVKAKNEQYKHYFWTDEDLGNAMAMALDASKTVGEL